MMTDTKFGLVQGKDMLYISQPSPLVFQLNLITFYRQFQNLTCKRNGATFPFIRKTPTLSSVTGCLMTQLTARTTQVTLVNSFLGSYLDNLVNLDHPQGSLQEILVSLLNSRQIWQLCFCNYSILA